MPKKIDLHQCKNLLEIVFGWRDITQNKLLKYGGGKFKCTTTLLIVILVWMFMNTTFTLSAL